MFSHFSVDILFLPYSQATCISSFLKEWSLKFSKLTKQHQKIQMSKNTDNTKLSNLKISKELFSPYNNHSLIFSSMDDSYYYLTEFYQKCFLMAFLIRNGPKRWYWVFAISHFPDIIFHKIRSFMIQAFLTNFTQLYYLRI